MAGAVPSTSTFPMLSGNGGEAIAEEVFVNSFISTVYGLKGRKMMARIL